MAAGPPARSATAQKVYGGLPGLLARAGPMPASGGQAGVTPAGGVSVKVSLAVSQKLNQRFMTRTFGRSAMKNASQVRFGGVPTQGQVRQQPNLIDAVTHA